MPQSALHQSILSHDTKKAKYLIRNSTLAKLIKPDSQGLTPLTVASREGLFHIVIELLYAGAPLDDNLLAETSSFHYALNNHHQLTAQILYLHDPNNFSALAKKLPQKINWDLIPSILAWAIHNKRLVQRNLLRSLISKIILFHPDAANVMRGLEELAVYYGQFEFVAALQSEKLQPIQAKFENKLVYRHTPENISPINFTSRQDNFRSTSDAMANKNYIALFSLTSPDHFWRCLKSRNRDVATHLLIHGSIDLCDVILSHADETIPQEMFDSFANIASLLHTACSRSLCQNILPSAELLSFINKYKKNICFTDLISTCIKERYQISLNNLKNIKDKILTFNNKLSSYDLGTVAFCFSRLQFVPPIRSRNESPLTQIFGNLFNYTVTKNYFTTDEKRTIACVSKQFQQNVLHTKLNSMNIEWRRNERLIVLDRLLEKIENFLRISEYVKISPPKSRALKVTIAMLNCLLGSMSLTYSEAARQAQDSFAKTLSTANKTCADLIDIRQCHYSFYTSLSDNCQSICDDYSSAAGSRAIAVFFGSLFFPLSILLICILSAPADFSLLFFPVVSTFSDIREAAEALFNEYKRRENNPLVYFSVNNTVGELIGEVSFLKILLRSEQRKLIAEKEAAEVEKLKAITAELRSEVRISIYDDAEPISPLRSGKEEIAEDDGTIPLLRNTWDSEDSDSDYNSNMTRMSSLRWR